MNSSCIGLDFLAWVLRHFAVGIPVMSVCLQLIWYDKPIPHSGLSYDERRFFGVIFNFLS